MIGLPSHHVQAPLHSRLKFADQDILLKLTTSHNAGLPTRTSYINTLPLTDEKGNWKPSSTGGRPSATGSTQSDTPTLALIL